MTQGNRNSPNERQIRNAARGRGLTAEERRALRRLSGRIEEKKQRSTLPSKPSTAQKVEGQQLDKQQKQAIAEQQVQEQLAKPLRSKWAPNPRTKENKKQLREEKAQQFKNDWKEKGIKEALDSQHKGLGTLMNKGLRIFLTPIGAKWVLRFFDTIGVNYFGGIFALLFAFLFVLFNSAIVAITIMSTSLVILFSTVMLVLFVYDERIDVSGIDMTGISDVDIFGGLTADVASAKNGGHATVPPELRGKFLAMYADTSPIQGLWMDWRATRYHFGVDYDWSQDKGSTPIYPAAEGIVHSVSVYRGGCIQGGNSSYGHFITIVHPDIIGSNGKPFVTRYAHLKEATTLKIGEKVYLDTVIGHIGTTGCSTGNHIHFELIPADPNNARQALGVNPDAYLTCSEDGRTVEDFREKKNGRYYFTECFEYQKKIRGVD